MAGVERVEYLRALLGRYATLTLPIETVIETAGGFRLDAIYQPLRLRRDPLTPEDRERAERQPRSEDGETEDGASGDEDEWQPDPTRADSSEDGRDAAEPAVLAEHSASALAQSPTRRMVILGGPGTGKTTALKRLISDAALDALSDDAAPLLVFVALPDLARAAVPLAHYFDLLVIGLGVEAAFAETLRAELAAGQLLICLDSLDEVIPALRPAMIARVNDWAAEAGNTWVVGSRFTEYKGGQFAHGRFAEWSLEPLDAAHRRELARRLLPALAAHTGHSSYTGGPRLSPTDFVAALEAHPQAAAWSANPLLFSLAAAVYSRAGVLPRSRAGLYGEVVRAVVRTREPDPIRAEEVRALLAEVSLRLYATAGRTFSRAQLVAVLAAIRSECGAASSAESQAERIIASGALDVVAHDTYAFTHQTFQEYLAAAALAADATSGDERRERTAWDFAWSRRTYSRWTETLRLFAGICAREHGAAGAAVVERWLLALAGQRALPEGDPGDLCLALAIRTLGELDDAAPEWQARAFEIGGQVLAAWVAAALAREPRDNEQRNQRLEQLATDIVTLDPALREVAVGVVVPALRDPHVSRAAADLLAALGGETALSAVLALRHDPDSSVRHMVATTLKRFGDDAPLDVLRELYHDPSQSVRLSALQALAARHADEDIPLLLAALRAGDHHVVTRAFVGYGDRAPVAELAEIARTGSQDARNSALAALATLGERAPVDVILEATRDHEWNIRQGAASALGALAPAGPIEPLMALLHDTQHYVANTAAYALGKYDVPAALDALISVVRNGNEKVRWSALAALGARAPLSLLEAALDADESRARDVALHAFATLRVSVPVARIRELMRHPSAHTRAEAALALAKLAARGLAPLEETLATLIELLDDGGYGVRGKVAEALSLLGEPGNHVEAARVLAAFTRPDDEALGSAMQLLAERKDAAAAALLTRLLRDPRSSIRANAAVALGAFGPLAPVDDLLAVLGENDAHLRSMAIGALGHLGERAPVDALVALLGDPDKTMRADAANALGKLGERMPVELLLAALRDSEQQVRRAATSSLSEAGARAPVAALCALLEDPSAPVREAAASALLKIAQKGAVPIPPEPLRRAMDPSNVAASKLLRNTAEATLLISDASVPIERLIEVAHGESDLPRRAAQEALKRRRAEVPSRLLLDLVSPRRDMISDFALDLLGTYGEDAPMEELLALARHEDAWVRRGAISVLGKLGDRVPVSVFVTALADYSSDVRYEAAEALEHRAPTTPDMPLEALRAALDDPGDDVRLAAARALAAAGEPLDLAICLEQLEGGLDTAYDASQTLIAYGGRIALPIERLVAILGSRDDDNQLAAWSVLTKLCPEALAPVFDEAENLLNNREYGLVFGSMVHTSAAYTITGMKHVPPLLLDYLTDLLGWHYHETRAAAVHALGHIRRNIPDSAIRTLLALRSDSEMGADADAALAEILSLEGGIEDE